MPQPLSRLPKIKSKSFGVDACNERPDHMLQVMRIIAAASFADHWLGNILVGLSPEKGLRLAKHFNSLENEAKKSASFEATATALLETDMHELLHLIVKAYRTAVKARHPFAHCRFGWTPDDEDLLMLVDPRPELISRAKRAALTAKPPKTREEAPAWFAAEAEASAEFEASIMCYRLAELQAIRESIVDATACLTQFWQITAGEPPPHIRDEIFAQLTQRLREKET